MHLLHGDDMVLPGFYPAMEQALADPTAVAAVCRAQDVDAHSSPTYITRSYRQGTGVWMNALDALAVSNRVRAPGIVVRRAAYERVGGYRTDLPHAADWEMWARLAAHGPVVFVDQVLACYRRHDTSDTSTRVSDRGQHPGAGHRDRGGGRPRSAEPTGPYQTQSPGVHHRVRHPHCSVTGHVRQVVRRRPPGTRGRPLRVAAAAWRSGSYARCRGRQRRTDRGLSPT